MTLKRLHLAPILRSRADFWTAIGFLTAWSALALVALGFVANYVLQGDARWIFLTVLTIWISANVYDYTLALRDYRDATTPKDPTA